MPLFTSNNLPLRAVSHGLMYGILLTTTTAVLSLFIMMHFMPFNHPKIWDFIYPQVSFFLQLFTYICLTMKFSTTMPLKNKATWWRILTCLIIFMMGIFMSYFSTGLALYFSLMMTNHLYPLQLFSWAALSISTSAVFSTWMLTLTLTWKFSYMTHL